MENDVDIRKFQELNCRLIEAVAHKEIAKWHRALFDAYKQQKFNDEQALKLVIASIQKSS